MLNYYQALVYNRLFVMGIFSRENLQARRQKGFGTVEMVLIIFVLVSLVIAFRTKVVGMVQSYLNRLDPGF